MRERLEEKKAEQPKKVTLAAWLEAHPMKKGQSITILDRGTYQIITTPQSVKVRVEK